jgi:hypothetical protein
MVVRYTRTEDGLQFAYQLYFFNEGLVFSLTTNQRTIFFNLTFQQNEQGVAKDGMKWSVAKLKLKCKTKLVHTKSSSLSAP